MGSDNFHSFPKWKNHHTILQTTNYMCTQDLIAKPHEPTSHPKVHLTQAPMMDVSASFIRKAIAKQKDISYLLPPKVWRYIDEMNFYK